MRWLISIAVLLLGTMAAEAHADVSERNIANGPDEICPLMIGAAVPDVALVTVDHRPVDLRDTLAKRPTILIYYRGGW